jgi:hypothetical protein
MVRNRYQQLRERLSDPLLTALTVLLAVVLFIVAPMQAAGAIAAHQLGIAFALVIVVAIFIVSNNWAAMIASGTAVALVIVATVLRLRQPSIIDIYLDAIAWMIFSLTLAYAVARAVFAPGTITFHRVIGAVLLYLDIAVIFVALYCFLALLVPDAFSGIKPLSDDLSVAANLIYFSFVTLTTVGYGDIIPVSPYARSLSNIEAVIGQLYPATLLARLVTLELESRRSR